MDDCRNNNWFVINMTILHKLLHYFCMCICDNWTMNLMPKGMCNPTLLLYEYSKVVGGLATRRDRRTDRRAYWLFVGKDRRNRTNVSVSLVRRYVDRGLDGQRTTTTPANGRRLCGCVWKCHGEVFVLISNCRWQSRMMPQEFSKHKWHSDNPNENSCKHFM